MTQAQVTGGRVQRVGLPQVGALADGRQVSGYDRLPADVLAAEGWVPYTEDRPDFDPETEQLVLDRYEVTPEGVIGVFVAAALPPPEPAPPSRDEFEALTDAVATLTIAALGGA